MEYYFGNKNYYQDKFLLNHAKTAKKQGYIPISTLLTFNRLKALTLDAS